MGLKERLKVLERDRPAGIRVKYVEPKSGKVLLDTKSGWQRLFDPGDEPAHLATNGSHLNSEKGMGDENLH
jgi:hypothetical protein